MKTNEYKNYMKKYLISKTRKLTHEGLFIWKVSALKKKKYTNVESDSDASEAEEQYEDDDATDDDDTNDSGDYNDSDYEEEEELENNKEQELENYNGESTIYLNLFMIINVLNLHFFYPLLTLDVAKKMKLQEEDAKDASGENELLKAAAIKKQRDDEFLANLVANY